jgi:ubiquinone/menaquinone biosynthesis C-methylase UbiE
MDWEQEADRFAAQALAANDPTAWFERLYASGVAGETGIPWDTEGPRPALVEWATGLDGHGRRAIVVGVGLGQSSEFIAGLGFATVAFDISPTAIDVIRRRFPQSTVEYLVADLLDPPASWTSAFDLVVEVFTVQNLPESLRERATAAIAGFTAPGGTLIVIARARFDHEPAQENPPWPLTRAQIDAFAADGLAPVRVELLSDRWWRAEFRRPA